MTEYAKLVVSVDSTQVGKAGTALGQLEKSSKRTEQSIGSLGSVVRSVAAPLAAFLSVRAVISAADQYGQMASRMKQATSSAEEYVSVQARLIDTANRTYRPLAEAQELFIRTADSLKSLGYETNAALDITDSFSYLLVTNAASADRAGSAINAYSKAIQTGKVDSESWQSILAAMPTIVDSLAAATGRSTQEVRELGIQGKLNLGALNEALRQSVQVNGQLADSMETSVGDAMTTLQNNFQVFVGRVNETSGATGGLVTSIEDLAEILSDPATIEAAQQLAAGVVSAFAAIASGVRETVSVVRWAADEMAATFHGAASDDIVRLEDQLKTYQEMLANPLKRLRIGGDNQAIKLFDEDEIRANIAATQRQIDEFWKSARTPPPAPPESGPQVVIKESATMVSAVAADTKRADTSIKKLATSYASIENSLARQLALYGQAGEVASLRFELEQGSLKGIVGQQAEYLIGLARELDAKRDLTEQEQLRIDILRESGQLRAANSAQFELEYAEKIAEYERQGNVEALQRLETLRRIREVQMNSERAPGTVEGVSKAPGSRGIDAVIGGPASEMMRLQEEAMALEEWRTIELEKQRGFFEAKAINEEQYAARVANIQEQSRQQQESLEASRQLVMLSSAENFFGGLSGLAKTFAGEQSGIYKAMFAVQKAAAIAQSVIAIQQGIAMAAANPWPANLAAMASVAAATAGIVSNISSVGMSFEGGGFTGYGPRSGGLDGKGGFMAMVHPNETIIDHTKGGNRTGKSDGKGNLTVHQTINVNGDVSEQTVEMIRRSQQNVFEELARDAKMNGPYTQMVRGKL